MRNPAGGPPRRPAAGPLTMEAGTLQKESHHHSGADAATHSTHLVDGLPGLHAFVPSSRHWDCCNQSRTRPRDAPGQEAGSESGVRGWRPRRLSGGSMVRSTFSLQKKRNNAKPTYVFCRHMGEGAGKAFVLMVTPCPPGTAPWTYTAPHVPSEILPHAQHGLGEPSEPSPQGNGARPSPLRGPRPLSSVAT